MSPSSSSVPVFVVGSGGMLAGEFFRLLEGHPTLELGAAVSREAGVPLARLHPHLSTTARTSSAAEGQAALATALANGPAALVLALPHGKSAVVWQEWRAALGAAAEELFVVDLSADHRLRDPEAYAAAYGHPHPAPDELARWVYGLPELTNGAVRQSRRVAAPGCFATAMQLATVPLHRAGLLDGDRPWIVHAITGSSGSGAEPKKTTHHPHRHGNLWAYARNGHRHLAELEQSCPNAPVRFQPHSGPFARGIHLTADLPLAFGAEPAAAQRALSEQYAATPFVDDLGEEIPDLRRVTGSNRACLSAAAHEDGVQVLVTLDNLGKGGAGQALQCLNLMLGEEETAGLPRAGLGVC